MELTREHYLSIIFHKFRRGLSRQECIDELKSLYGDEASSYSTVKNWFDELNGRRSLKGEVREGPSKTAKKWFEEFNGRRSLKVEVREGPPKTVKNWFDVFNSQRSLKGKIREGPPKTIVVTENIDALCELMMEDRHVIYREIDPLLGISPTSIHSILHEHLAVTILILVGSRTI